jgi:signal transduction histidine kinase
MRRRLIVSTALIALAAVIVLGVPLGIVESRRAHSEATARLEREADAVAAAVDDRIEAGRPLRAASLSRFVRAGHWVTVTRPGGRRTVIGQPSPGARLTASSGLAGRTRVVASAPSAEPAERERHIWLLVGALAVGGIGAAALLAWLQAERLARPLVRLAQSARQLGTGDFSARTERSGIPEIDAVAVALDATAARVARLLARERSFSTDVSHQLRTPLTALRLRLEELSLLREADLVAAEAEEALAEADRLERLIAELLSAARRPGGQPGTTIELGALARRHVHRWERTFAGAGRHLRLTTGAPVLIRGTPGAIGQALDVLLENGLRHGGGDVLVRVLHRRGQGCLRVEDHGAGIPDGAEEEIFRRGSSLAGGTGIGLDLARALVESDRGRLVLARRRPAAFEIRLHTAAGADEAAPGERPAESAAR